MRLALPDHPKMIRELRVIDCVAIKYQPAVPHRRSARKRLGHASKAFDDVIDPQGLTRWH